MSKKKDSKKNEHEIEEMPDFGNQPGPVKKRRQAPPADEGQELQPMQMQPPPPGKKGKKGGDGGATAGGGMMNFVGGGDQRGLLDNDQYDDDGDMESGHPAGKKQKSNQIRGNQDLWLLYLLFKAISLLW